MKENNGTRKALGKGLEELFNGGKIDINNFEREIVSSTPQNDVKEINLDEIRSNPYQPRTYFDEDALNELADSIKQHGVIEPIILKKSIRGYELIAGERRTKASRLAGLKTIPAIIKDFNDQEMMEIALIENIQREDLNPIEEAKAFKNIMNKLNMTQEEVSKRFGKSRSYITNLLGLLNLPEDVKKSVEDGSVSSSHARVLSKLNDEDQIKTLLERIKNQGMTVRELEDISRNEDVPKKKQIKRVEKVSNSRYHIYENSLKDAVGNKVSIKDNKITISFDSDSDLDRIMEIFNIEIGE